LPATSRSTQRLLALSERIWAWKGRAPTNRIVIFTGRRETQRFCAATWRRSGASEGAVVQLDGAMPDGEQTRVVEQFAQEKEACGIWWPRGGPEGLELHYSAPGWCISYPLVLVDDPAATQWPHRPLTAQSQQPQIRYMLTQFAARGW